MNIPAHRKTARGCVVQQTETTTRRIRRRSREGKHEREREHTARTRKRWTRAVPGGRYWRWALRVLGWIWRPVQWAWWVVRWIWRWQDWILVATLVMLVVVSAVLLWVRGLVGGHVWREGEGPRSHAVGELCPQRADEALLRDSPAVAPVCALVEAADAVVKEVEQNDEMRPLPYNLDVRRREVVNVAVVMKRMPGRWFVENLDLSAHVQTYSLYSRYTTTTLVRFLEQNIALCGKIAYVFTCMGNEVIDITLKDRYIRNMRHKREQLVNTHRNAVSQILKNIHEVLFELSSLEKSARVMDTALVAIKNDLRVYQQQMTDKQGWIDKSWRYFSGWNEASEAELFKLQTYVDRIIADGYHLSTIVNDSTRNLSTIISMLKSIKNRLEDHFSGSDLSSNMMASIYQNLVAVYWRVIKTQDTLNQAHGLHQKVEDQLKGGNNLTEIPWSKYKMIDAGRPRPPR
ncbi:hypothetical protein MMC11_004736 [Xylographa trunciseda]|nr:hypothetical protein [Xylographa trunciseda]